MSEELRIMSRTRVAAVCLAAGLLAGAFRAWPVAAQAPAPAPYLDPDLDFEARARDLVSQLPPFADYAMEGRTYRYFRGEPLFPFGPG
jgi:hypothetical protein